eukprot:6890525-Lingulodinium_polyedra.AAC.1
MTGISKHVGPPARGQHALDASGVDGAVDVAHHECGDVAQVAHPRDRARDQTRVVGSRCGPLGLS